MRSKKEIDEMFNEYIFEVDVNKKEKALHIKRCENDMVHYHDFSKSINALIKMRERRNKIKKLLKK